MAALAASQGREAVKRTPSGRAIYGTAIDARGLVCRVQASAYQDVDSPLALVLICAPPGTLRGSALLDRAEARELARALLAFADGAA